MAVRTAGAGEKAPGILVKIGRFFADGYAEMLKVIWPSFEEVRKFTMVVLLAVTAIGIFIWLCDLVFTQISVPLYGMSK